MAAAMLDAVPRTEAQQYCRRALTCYREVDDKAGAALASCRLGWTLHQCGHVDDPHTVRFMEAGIALAREVGDDWVTALGLNYLADYASMVAPRDFDRAEALSLEALAHFRIVGDWSRVADVLNLLSIISQFRLHFQAAVDYAEQALDVARTTGDALTEMNARWRIGQNMRYLGDVLRAIVLMEDCLQFTRERLTDLDTLWPLGILSMAVNAAGDYARAQALLIEMVRIIRSSVGLTSWRYGLVDCFAAVASARGDALRAARLWGTGDAGWAGNRNPNHVWDYAPLVAKMRAALGDDAFEAAHAEGRAMTLEQAIDYALVPTD
jgi:hypothetical protein